MALPGAEAAASAAALRQHSSHTHSHSLYWTPAKEPCLSLKQPETIRDACPLLYTLSLQCVSLQMVSSLSLHLLAAYVVPSSETDTSAAFAVLCTWLGPRHFAMLQHSACCIWPGRGPRWLTNVWASCLHHSCAAVHRACICAVVWHAIQDQLPSRLGGPALPEGPALPVVLRPLPALAGLEGRERAWCTMHKSASLPGGRAQAADTFKSLA